MTVWDRFVGHPRTLQVLQGIAQRPTGTYLLAGSTGTGKTIAAELLAAALVCPDACGECQVCARVFKHLHPDVTVLQPEGYTHPVEALRVAAASASQSPIESSHRVLIIQEADRIGERSQNALLKALEEPNRSVVWILLTNAVDAFLPTVLSRCQIIDFPPVGRAELVTQLQRRYELGFEDAFRYVEEADGDPDAVIRLIEQPEESELRTRAQRIVEAEDLTPVEALGAAQSVLDVATRVRGRIEAEQAEQISDVEKVSGRQGLATWKKRQAERNKRHLRRVEAETQIAYMYWLAGACRGRASRSASDPAAARFWVDMMQGCLDGQLAIRANANAALVLEALLLRLVRAP